jgi:tetratricopeptide (TPR) repeat protein
MLRPAVLVVPFCVSLALAVTSARVAGQRPSPAYVGNDACVPCHKAIVESYAQTAMARTSGPALPAIVEGSFRHPLSGVSYRVHRDGTRAMLSYDRSTAPELHGSQELSYYVGSNTRGRTFLFSVDRFLYQAPINYYAGKHGWDMAPGDAQLREMQLNHPVDDTCLFCHTSRVQPREAGTINRFSGAPFLQAGVSCERCHGPGGDHAAGHGAMVDPAKLTSARRDDICMQCHLEGAGRVAVASHRQADYRPGDTLSDYLAIFVRENAASDRLGAVSQFEALALSACRRQSNGALTCTSCHDPHVQVSASQRTEFYRGKCLTCHSTLAAAHHAETRDCTSCHMPRLSSVDIGHTMVTDHRILRNPRPQATATAPPVTRIVQFNNPTPSPRELGLAYGEVALGGNASAGSEAFRLLQHSLQAGQDDADVLVRLAYLQQMRGDLDEAQRLYGRALARDPDRAVAAANLGVLEARHGRLAAALTLWRAAFDKNPYLTALGINLARGLCDTGNGDEARAVAQRALRHNPDSSATRQLVSELATTGCVKR